VATADENARNATDADAATRDVVTAHDTTHDAVTAGTDTRDVPDADATTHDVVIARETTHDVVIAEESAHDPVAAATRDVGAAGDETTHDIASADRTTRYIGSGGTQIRDAGKADEPTQTVAADEPTEAVVAPAVADGDEKTKILRLPAAARDLGAGSGGIDAGHRTQVIRAAGHGEETQVIRPSSLEPPGERTQLLTFPAPGETTVATPAGERATQVTAPQETTKPMSIVGEERPDPVEDPTIRLNLPAREPGAATTLANKDRRAMTITNLERPADEAADDTRPLAIPAPRQPADDDRPRKL
jgi:hypothetical protein